MKMTAYTRDTLIRDVLTSREGSVAVFERYGLGCAVCLGADMETLASVAIMHEISVDELLDDLNALGPSNSEVEA
jgi:hybrid cluster-associated redox disulfide protein